MNELLAMMILRWIIHHHRLIAELVMSNLALLDTSMSLVLTYKARLGEAARPELSEHGRVKRGML